MLNISKAIAPRITSLSAPIQSLIIYYIRPIIYSLTIFPCVYKDEYQVLETDSHQLGTEFCIMKGAFW